MKRHLFALLLLFAACGGTAVIDDGSSSNASSSASGPNGCTDHSQCDGDDLCIFTTGECAPPCPVDCDSCAAGFACDSCATSSTPESKDCRAACVTAGPGQCDDHDDCAAGELCLYGEGRCTPVCDAGGGCPGDLICEGCATSSCPCCADCGAACITP